MGTEVNPFAPDEEWEWELAPADEQVRLSVDDIDQFHHASACLLSRSDLPPHMRDKVRYLMKRVDECFALTMLETAWNASPTATSPSDAPQ